MADMSGQSESVRILLVEDNADDEFLAIWALKHAGIEEIAVVRDGSEVLDRLSGPEPFPDLLVLDLCLPKIDGREVLRRVREDSRTRKLPILILTSSEDGGDKEICRRFGLSSLATVHKHLTNLQEKGFIRRAWNRSRSVELLPSRSGGRAIELPMLGYVAAGMPIEAVAGNETISVPDSLVAGKRDTYVLRVRG